MFPLGTTVLPRLYARASFVTAGALITPPDKRLASRIDDQTLSVAQPSEMKMGCGNHSPG